MTLRTALACLLALALTLSACAPDREDHATGRYTAATGDTDIVLTLAESGRGTWSTDTDEITFKWSTPKADHLWLHTREGGVIQGRFNDGRLTIALPGVGELVFERQ
ncbi:hypothetical protein [Pseudodesulfovibrio pelocollis]|uniref:hypothetical protein n=1 Tax=Pseudodesulfovibrio pelocollis TaxID=3051432 RepID=UPI00255AD7B2|nr:hypothetical protein [Pseudodesulfovibrio sp. SB368]